MLELPDSPTDHLKLADWLELYALISPDLNSSQGDLEGALRVSALFDSGDNERIERQSLEIFDELEQRVNAAGEAYPFQLNYSGVLQVRSSWEKFPAYIFCLCLSYFGSEDSKPRKLFEQVSCLAARKYLQGEVIGFGAPRTELPSSFSEAVTEMCRHIGEGQSYKDQPSLSSKDDRLDLVAWKDFRDKLSSKILMFGQCASGWDWEDKLTELRPEAFCGNWMADFPTSPLIRSFFTPHRIERRKWNWATRNAGILFDRCRVAYWAHGEEADYNHHLAWSKDLLTRVAL